MEGGGEHRVNDPPPQFSEILRTDSGRGSILRMDFFSAVENSGDQKKKDPQFSFF